MTDIKTGLTNLYAMFRQRGIDQTLLGVEKPDLISQCLERIPVPETIPHFLFEITLCGIPRHDLILSVPSDLSGDLYQFYEFDLSENSSYPNSYLIPRRSYTMEHLFTYLRTQGEENRFRMLSEIFERAPGNWEPYYAILFSGRGVKSTRISFKIRETNPAEEHKAFLNGLSGIGYTLPQGTMKEQLPAVLGNGIMTEVMLDVLPDGQFGPVLGISRFRAGKEELSRLGILSENYGIGDRRWRNINRMSFCEENNGVSYKTEFNSVKFRWDNGRMMPAKVYIKSVISDVT